MARWMKRSRLTPWMMLWGVGEGHWLCGRGTQTSSGPPSCHHSCQASPPASSSPPPFIPSLLPARCALLVAYGQLLLPRGQGFCPDLVGSSSLSKSPPRLAVSQRGPGECPRRFSGLAPGQVEGQLVQLPRVCLGSLHQIHLAARRGEGPHLLQQRGPGPVQVCGQVLVLLGGGEG